MGLQASVNFLEVNTSTWWVAYHGQKDEVGDCVYGAANHKVTPNIDTTSTELRCEFSAESLPEFVHRNALEYRHEHAGDCEGDNEDKSTDK